MFYKTLGSLGSWPTSPTGGPSETPWGFSRSHRFANQPGPWAPFAPSETSASRLGFPGRRLGVSQGCIGSVPGSCASRAGTPPLIEGWTGFRTAGEMPAKILLASPAVRKPRCNQAHTPVSARQGKCRPKFYWPSPRFGNHGVIKHSAQG